MLTAAAHDHAAEADRSAREEAADRRAEAFELWRDSLTDAQIAAFMVDFFDATTALGGLVKSESNTDAYGRRAVVAVDLHREFDNWLMDHRWPGEADDTPCIADMFAAAVSVRGWA